MNSILSAAGEAVLDELAARHALLAFDFDGTLAPVVADRAAAAVPPATVRLLRALALLYPCAVVSGRARAVVAARLDRVPLFAVVGNHGAETGFARVHREPLAAVRSWIRTLKSELGLFPGVEVEDKGLSLAVHFRHAPSRAAARALVTAAASSLEGARVVGGRAVVNVVPCEAPGKASAVERLSWRAGRRPVLYVGDDRSDEEAFGAADVAVRVGRTARSVARWYVAGQGAVEDLLRALLAARTRLDGLGDCADRLARAVGD